MTGLFQDVRYARRQLWRKPWFTAVAVLTLAIGIGMNTAVFSVVNATVFRLPLPRAQELVVIANSYSESDQTPTSFPDFLDWRQQSQSFSQLVASFRSSFNLTGVQEPERIRGGYTSQGYFELFGVRPLLGRDFLPAEHVKGSMNVCLISQDFWRRELSSDPAAVGRTLVLNSVAYSIVGIMPAKTPNLDSPPASDLWLPLESKPPYETHGTNYLRVIGRLKPGVTRENAASELRVIQERINAQFPPNKHDVMLLPLTEVVLGNVRPLLEILLAAVALVLLIACANVANLLLVRGAGRMHEFALREALGAKRWHVVRQLVTESALLAAIALLASVLLTWGGARVLLDLWPANQSLPEVTLDWRVVVFAALISLLAVAASGLAPALLTSRVHLNVVMKEGGQQSTKTGGHGRVRTGFVVAEMALALVLVVASALTLRSFSRMLDTGAGFNAQGLVTARVALPEKRYSEAASQRFFAELLSRVRRLPGVQSAAATAYVPLGSGGQTGDFQVEGRPSQGSQGPFAEEHFVSTGYFQTMQIPLLRGRSFSETDTGDAPKVIVINRYMERQLWPGENALGKRIHVLGRPQEWNQIIGVVADVKTDAINSPPAMQVYLSTQQYSVADLFLVVRASTDAAGLIPAIKNAVFRLDNQQPVANIALMDQLLSRSLSGSRSSASLLGIFAGVALLLAALGIYAVMAYSVSQRVHEIGIRMALGARGEDIQRMIMKKCASICGWGLGIGLLAALLATRLLKSLLFGIGPNDASTLVLSILLLGGTAALASYLPARRAAKVDPIVALHYE